jgi:RNA polymerase sigma-70 factor (ECF subfamily)
MGFLGTKRDPLRDEFDAEVLPHLDALYANALRLTHSRTDAEDLVQETVLRAFRFFDRFERGTNVKAWLLRIQYNTFVNRYRRNTREREIKDTMAVEPSGEEVVSRAALRALTDPSGNALRPLIAREIEAALDALPEEQRLVVVLADIEELSYKEIAEVLGCPIGTVMSRLHRSRRALRAHLIDQVDVEQPRADQAHATKPAATTTPSAVSEAEPAVSLEAYRRVRRRG